MPSAKADIVTFKDRTNFLFVAATGQKWVARHFILQMGPPFPTEDGLVKRGPLAYGLTASKKVGNAVVRNRARRRLRALVREIMAPNADTTKTYVLIARASTATAPYADLRDDLVKALKKLKVWEGAA